MAKLEITQSAIEECGCWLAFCGRTNPETTWLGCVRNNTEAFIIGMYYQAWATEVDIPYYVRSYIHRIEKVIEPYLQQISFWTDKYTNNGEKEIENYIRYYEYLLDNVMLNDAPQLALAAYLGKKWGIMKKVGVPLTMKNLLCFIRTTSEHFYVGLVAKHEGSEVWLSDAHEIYTGCGGSLDRVLQFGNVSLWIPSMMLCDAAEVRPCTLDVLAPFCKRTGCTTYDTYMGSVSQS